jgi:hypothetical protein
MTLRVGEPYSVDDRMINEYGALEEMKIGRENRSSRRKCTIVLLCPLQILYDLGSNPSLRSGKPARPMSMKIIMIIKRASSFFHILFQLLMI